MFQGIPLVGLTAPALLGLAVLLLLMGKIVPRSTMVDKIRECEQWRQACEAEREIRITSDGQTVELLELAKTTNSIIFALFTATTGHTPPVGGADGYPTSREIPR
jgi:hypothetical protein